MTCNRCGKATDYYYMAGPVILCEDCACNSVSALADEGLFPFFDNVVPVQIGDGTYVAIDNEEPVPAEEPDAASVPTEEQEKAVLSSAYGMMAENT